MEHVGYGILGAKFKIGKATIQYMETCYICDNEAVWKCPTCGSKCCSRHLKKIHMPRCKIGNTEKTSRIESKIM
jgi:hypothetical protein